MMPLLVKPISAMYCVICVVLPDPVSPITTSTWLSAMARQSSALSVAMGSPRRCSRMDLSLILPKESPLPCALLFHSGSSKVPPRLMPRSSCAKCRSPSSGIGSSHGRLRSFGIESISCCDCAAFISRRSLASSTCVVAARCIDPSGLRNTRTGSSSRVKRDCPRRNGGSTSLISTSRSSSVSTLAPRRPEDPTSSSTSSRALAGSCPEFTSCRSSQRSGLLSRLRRRPDTPPPPPGAPGAPGAACGLPLRASPPGKCRQ